MPYIPSDWITKEENTETVHKLLDELDQDLEDGTNNEKEVIKQLEKLEEYQIVEKLKTNQFNFGA